MAPTRPIIKECPFVIKKHPRGYRIHLFDEDGNVGAALGEWRYSRQDLNDRSQIDVIESATIYLAVLEADLSFERLRGRGFFYATENTARKAKRIAQEALENFRYNYPFTPRQRKMYAENGLRGPKK